MRNKKDFVLYFIIACFISSAICFGIQIQKLVIKGAIIEALEEQSK